MGDELPRWINKTTPASYNNDMAAFNVETAISMLDDKPMDKDLLKDALKTINETSKVLQRNETELCALQARVGFTMDILRKKNSSLT